jgi:predicted DNA-binding transcriptional regulator AlpA
MRSPMMTDQPLLSARTVCKMLGISRATLWRMQRSNEFPASIKITERRIAWRRDAVERWLDDRARGRTVQIHGRQGQP